MYKTLPYAHIEYHGELNAKILLFGKEPIRDC